MSAERDLAALIGVIEARSARGFAWRGRRDCAGFVSRCAEAQTGIDPLGTLRWNSRREAWQVLAAEGGLEAAMDARFDRIAPAMAQRGDIAGVPDTASGGRMGLRLMIVEGAMLVGPDRHGLGRQKRSEMTMAWDVMSVRAVGAKDGQA